MDKKPLKSSLMSSAISMQNPDRIRVFCMFTFNFALKFKLNLKLNGFEP